MAILLRDRDGICRPGFDKVFHDVGIKATRNGLQRSNLQAHIERLVQILQQDALDHFIVFGEKHFDYLVSEYVEHYHNERPHQAMGNVPLTGDWPERKDDRPDTIPIECRTRLGGLLRHYEWPAA